VCLIRAERLSKVKLLWLVNQDSADHAARPGGEAFDPLDGFPLLDESEARLHLATALSMVAQAIGIMAPSQAACSTRFFSSFISTLIHQLDKGTSWDSLSRFYQAVVARIEEPISSFSPFNAEVEATLAPNLAVPPSSSHLLCPGLGLFPRAFLLDLDVSSSIHTSLHTSLQLHTSRQHAPSCAVRARTYCNACRRAAAWPRRRRCCRSWAP
jgi:hypothetical protein